MLAYKILNDMAASRTPEVQDTLLYGDEKTPATGCGLVCSTAHIMCPSEDQTVIMTS